MPNTNVCDNCGTTANFAGPTQELENKYKKFWRPIAAYVYLGICIFDFAAMPFFMEVRFDEGRAAAMAEIRLFETPEVRMEALKQLDFKRAAWEPLTLQGGALFHLAFGAILGVSAWTRGTEKTAAIQQGR